ncbi:MAG: peptidylprolyl isomerase [Saprospiraceae bacterium]|nr:peptidylprolyl isomerase [Saprospiraceae bacterium]
MYKPIFGALVLVLLLFTSCKEKSVYIKIETDKGDMIVRLYDETPLHKANMMKLVEDGYYEDLLFHRVIENFMVQGGDPDSRNAPAGARLGTGGPDYLVDAEIMDSLFHKKGALSAARSPDQVNPERKSSGSQFYIVQGKPYSDIELDLMEQRFGRSIPAEQREIYKTQGGYPSLDGQYTVFGEVVAGLEVIDAIAAVERDRNNRPIEDIKMKMSFVKWKDN